MKCSYCQYINNDYIVRVSSRKKMFGGEVVASAVQNVLRLINLSPNMVLPMM